MRRRFGGARPGRRRPRIFRRWHGHEGVVGRAYPVGRGARRRRGRYGPCRWPPYRPCRPNRAQACNPRPFTGSAANDQRPYGSALPPSHLPCHPNDPHARTPALQFLKNQGGVLSPKMVTLVRDFQVGFEGSFGAQHLSPRGLLSKFLCQVQYSTAPLATPLATARMVPTSAHPMTSHSMTSHTSSPPPLPPSLPPQMVCVEGIVTKCSLVSPKVVRSVHYCPATGGHEERNYRDATCECQHNISTGRPFLRTHCRTVPTSPPSKYHRGHPHKHTNTAPSPHPAHAHDTTASPQLWTSA